MNEILPLKELFSSIQGEGECAGRRQIFIRLTGCNLTCSYCDTDHESAVGCRVESQPGSGTFNTDLKPLTESQLLEIVDEWCSRLPKVHHSISVTGGEPLLHADLLMRVLPKLRSLLPVHLETNGTLPHQLRKVIDDLDGVSMDMKLPSSARCDLALWEAHRDFLSVASAVRVSVKLVVAASTSVEEIFKACSIVKDVDSNAALFIQPLTNRDGTIGVSACHLLRLQETASRIVTDVRVIPQMHLMMGAL